MNKHHALTKYNLTKSKLFTCFIAVVLALGLSAMPAHAAPESDGAESTISIVAVDTTSETAEAEADAKADTKAPAETPKKDASSSAASTKEPAKSEAAAESKKDTAEDVDAKTEAPAKKELSAAEKAAAVFEGEAELAIANSTGLSAQSSYSSYDEDDPKEDIKNQITSMASSYTYDIRLQKFMSGPLFTTTDENGQAKPASYTVMFEIEGKASDTSSDIVYSKRSVGVVVAHDGSGKLELKDLPRGYYTIKEIVGYPGCPYVCTSAQTINFWIGYEAHQTDQGKDGSILKYDTDQGKQVITATATFKNKANETQKIYSQGYVNHYSMSDKGLTYEPEN